MQSRPDWQPTLETLACCYGALNRWDDARRCVAQMSGLPRPAGDALAPLKDRNPSWRDQMTDLLWTARRSEEPDVDS